MGSSDERKAIDASVGGLVWVRRRNGSWWPGRIVAHHEVPDNCIVSPKSGTPIKLLGREDASVDWYNLEKSKRVKAFRCGEYDACIETAKATAMGVSKKAVKYARREDAIAHALEIENAHLAKDNPELFTGADGSCTDKARIRRRVSSKGNEDSTDVAKTEESSMSLRKTNYGKASTVKPLSEKRRRTPNASEDDGTEGNKRMRGLEDIGIGIGSKAKVQVGALLEPKEENGSESDIKINGSMPNGALVEAIHSKAKESEISSISVSGKDESSNGLFDVPLIGEDKYSAGIPTAAFTSSSPRKALVSGPTRQSGESSHDDMVKNEGSNGSACTTSPAAALINGIEISTSKWQLKGKRNPRQMSKKQEERRIAYAEEANNNSLALCLVSDHEPLGNFSVGTQAMGRNSQLYDVNIEVKANYKPRSVPLISLRSKLNGEAIVGHPSTVEVLEDGSCDRVLYNHTKSLGFPIVDNDVKPKPSWNKKSKNKKPHIPPHKPSSKSKKSSPLSKKTRFLSALSGQKLTVVSKEKLMTEKTKEQVVACIPLKVVFSRINEAVKGSPRQVHRALPSAGNT
uniref:PWWP domain-containing protein n=1 Tax=Noccaea caerulescens TaxID=107243 RepID=A0A1J3I4W6_NOCCA